MIKLYCGGSPCTHWSIAQTKNRETEPSGLGWELFQNYVIGLRKYKPDYFLYENNKSMAPAIKAQITKELGVEPILINSSLLSSQNRQRFYWTNIPGVTQPEDRGILLRDILETGIAWKEKSYTLDANYFKGSLPDRTLEKHRRSLVAEPVRIGTIENDSGTVNNICQSSRVYSPVGKSVALRAQGGGGGAKSGLYAVPIMNTPAALRYERTETAKKLRKAYEQGEIKHGYHEFHELHPRTDGKSNTVTTVLKDNMIIEKWDGKTNTLTTVHKDNLVVDQYEELVPYVERKLSEIVDKYGYLPETFNPYNSSEIKGKTPTLTASMGRQTSSASVFNIIHSNGKEHPVYEVLNGQITINDKQYPIKLQDGYYIIRKLTVKECMRLQTVPETYIFPVSDSQSFKMLGNGWTCDVISHILSFIPGITTEEIEVMSMYDGMSCGHIALDKLGANVVRYYATEIDKYAIQTAKHNYPMMEHIGDAYQVRDHDWIFTASEGKTYDGNELIGQMSIDDWITI